MDMSKSKLDARTREIWVDGEETFCVFERPTRAFGNDKWSYYIQVSVKYQINDSIVIFIQQTT